MTNSMIAIAGAALATSVLFGASTGEAAVNVSINSAPYVFASYDTAGNSIAGNVVVSAPNQITNNDTAFYTASYSFNLATAADTLSITGFSADDRSVVELNGTVVAAVGIYGPGTGSFIFTPTGPQTSQTFLGNGLQSLTISGPFVAGSNTIELIVNNTGNGIYGGLTQGPSSLDFSGVVNSPSGVPEPSTWALMLVGFGGLGSVLRSIRKKSTAAA